VDDLDQAITLKEQAVASTPPDHPDRVERFNSLGSALQRRFERTGSMNDLVQAITSKEKAVVIDIATSSIRLKAARSCSELLISLRRYKSAKPILEAAVRLCPSINSRALMRSDQQFNISQFANITSRDVSISCADADYPFNSLQLLELGRGILANLELEVRSNISELGADHPEFAQQFQELRNHIDSTSRTFESGILEDQLDGFNSTSNLSTFISNRRSLLKQFDDLLEHIRSLQGFENFLKGPSEKELCSLAKGGATVVFNVSDIRLDALLITTDGIRAVNIPLLRSDTIQSHAKSFTEAIYEQDANRYSHATRKINSVLKGLWDCGLKAILDELGYTEVPPGGQLWPRIWWVGSGLLNILPIHAAGYHDSDPPQTVLDRVVLSYTYTARSLSYEKRRK
jgi:hypothetical protein